ncbi:hypothetical protein HBH56_072310 [Parastagonospora nodorum]|uniref:BTB domain-containing protein n=2 Tax=Phaeosphaeria nodorum (strain SN15 / ATCC MYA-4574 / FGSC 10173) TaxID=321614 RepID=A0A7U2IB50_PHANO|nr:hypothetical protein SNOG_13516 [Parastagonospora nodorum SN15]KAH3915303.1 hypothetical protein HBH56_072310 [Parastagonospora nodorum]EAT78963.1 hypothetical protein SNOG_13516 [Parastagonospora nodorum SN15]KAH3927294.1 hypothetical protein HBH54_152540 [Parastagonospora nodorum]KAH3952183.1 hypothetical protein HBH53_055830 [Parastagonospora nodorum]KAH3981536.1 hypothetical protein HBH51_039290 [Parastagonospora nodorum]
MAPAFPYTNYANASAGEPITYCVGPKSTSTRFDIHQLLLCTSSPLFNEPSGVPKIITRPLYLPTIDPTIFRLICVWLYEGIPPAAETPNDLLILMKIWVALSKLGIWEKQNTIMRLGMALMQPREFTCGIETVRWVYENTAPGSKLRGYVVAIFCQRGAEITKEMFSPRIEKLGIFRDAVKFFKILNRVRAGNPRGVDGYGFHASEDVLYMWDVNDPSRVVATVVVDLEEVDYSRIRYPLPSFLVWGDRWEDLPDKFFFIHKNEGLKEGKEVLKQLRRM